MTSGACIARFWRTGWGWTPSLLSVERLKSSRTSSRGEHGMGERLTLPSRLAYHIHVLKDELPCLQKRSQDEPMTIATTWGEAPRSAWGLTTRWPWPWMRTG